MSADENRAEERTEDRPREEDRERSSEGGDRSENRDPREGGDRGPRPEGGGYRPRPEGGGFRPRTEGGYRGPRGGGGRDDYDRRDDDRGGGRGGRYRAFFRKKVCKFCTQNIPLDYKDVDLMKRFTTDRGKILPRRITGNCAKHQRKLATAVKRARVLAWLPFVGR